MHYSAVKQIGYIFHFSTNNYVSQCIYWAISHLFSGAATTSSFLERLPPPRRRPLPRSYLRWSRRPRLRSWRTITGWRSTVSTARILLHNRSKTSDKFSSLTFFSCNVNPRLRRVPLTVVLYCTVLFSSVHSRQSRRWRKRKRPQQERRRRRDLERRREWQSGGRGGGA